METIEHLFKTLDGYSFHDMPVETIAFSTEHGTGLKIELLEYNESKKDYDRLRLIFRNIQNLECSSISLKNDSDLELFSFDYSFSGLFKCKFLFLTGFSAPDFTLEFSCETMELLQQPD